MDGDVIAFEVDDDKDEVNSKEEVVVNKGEDLIFGEDKEEKRYLTFVGDKVAALEIKSSNKGGLYTKGPWHKVSEMLTWSLLLLHCRVRQKLGVHMVVTTWKPWHSIIDPMS